MKNLIVVTGLLILSSGFVYCQQDPNLELNKEIARKFYEDLWFTNNTQNYGKYVADSYVVHDIGDRKGVTEPAVEQKNIADFFWKHGDLIGKIDYQIAEGDLVATRWTTHMKPKTLFGRFGINPPEPFSIINVFRIKDGKIVELWNHRHDIETPQTLRFVFQGIAIGLCFSIIPIAVIFRMRKRIKGLEGG